VVVLSPRRSAFLLIIAASMTTAACSDTSPSAPINASAPTKADATRPFGYIRSEELGDRWPLTVPAGQLRCDSSGPRTGQVVFVVNSATDAINGFARSQIKAKGWREVDPIWRDNPAIPGSKIDISPLIERGLSLC